MKTVLKTFLILLALTTSCTAQTSEGRATSEVMATPAGDLILKQQVVIEAPVERVWRAYTTSEGWRAWVAPLAEVDLRVGGQIRTSYKADGELGDENTNVLTVLNYVPEKLLTLQARSSDAWPELLLSRSRQLYNVILFESLEGGGTRVVSYGTGYDDTAEFRKLLDFFIPANEKSLNQLVDYLERSESR